MRGQPSESVEAEPELLGPRLAAPSGRELTWGQIPEPLCRVAALSAAEGERRGDLGVAGPAPLGAGICASRAIRAANPSSRRREGRAAWTPPGLKAAVTPPPSMRRGGPWGAAARLRGPSHCRCSQFHVHAANTRSRSSAPGTPAGPASPVPNCALRTKH